MFEFNLHLQIDRLNDGDESHQTMCIWENIFVLKII